MSDTADLVLLDADVLTMDPAHPRATALAVRGGRVVAIGDAADVRPLVGAGTRVVDANGRFAMPGFYDSHNHMLNTGLGLVRPRLSGAEDIAGVQAVVAAAAAAAPAETWVQTSPAWHENQLVERRLPTAGELDAVSGDHPVVVRRGGHNLVLNSAGLALAGIDATTPNPPGGTFVRDAAGALTGQVVGKGALAKVLPVLPLVTDEEWGRALAAVSTAYAEAGITSVIEPGLSAEQMSWLRTQAAEGRLSTHVSMLWMAPVTGRTPAEAVEVLREGHLVLDLDDEWCRTTGVKLIADGGVETGYYREPYARVDDPAHPCGKPLLDRELLVGIARELIRTGIPAGIHTLGDATADMVLDSLVAAAAAEGVATLPHWSLIHFLNPRPEHWAHVRALDLTVAVQPSLVAALAGGFVDYLGRERAAALSPLPEVLEHRPGRVGGGSDSPVAPHPPLSGIAAAVTRATSEGVLGPESRIPVERALSLYTTGSAWCGREAHTKGSLTPGRFGDVVVLSADPTRTPAAELADLEVLCTVVSGRVIHDRLS